MDFVPDATLRWDDSTVKLLRVQGIVGSNIEGCIAAEQSGASNYAPGTRARCNPDRATE